MRDVYLIGEARLPVAKKNPVALRTMGAEVLRTALSQANRSDFDALYVSCLLGDALEQQQHVAPLIASAAGIVGRECYDVLAATAAGAAALRTAYLAIASGAARTAVALGVERMSAGDATPALARVLDAEHEQAQGQNMLTMNARLMERYLERYGVAREVFANFAVNAHCNAQHNPLALFRREFTREQILNSPQVDGPLHVMDCAPICDGAAAVVLSAEPPQNDARLSRKIRVRASTVATDHLRVDQRPEPLELNASRWSAERAFAQADLSPRNIDFFEAHDAFTIMSCLALEACGFAEAGTGWRLAESEAIFPEGDLPMSVCGGLKARGHPVGASALYQIAEIFQQLQGTAGENQLKRNRTALTQSIGGAGTTIITHILQAD